MSEKNYKENDFIADMLFPRYENEKYLLNLKFVNDGEIFVGTFRSYFELFQHINRTKVREELSIKDDKQKVWNIARILPESKMVAHWILSTDNETLFWNIKDDYVEKLKNPQCGKIYIWGEEKNDYLICLGKLCDGTYKFIRVTMEDIPMLDMEYVASQEQFNNLKKATGVMSDVVCEISNKLISNPHNYFLWLFYWRPFSKWGKEEQNRCMKQIILSEET